jgi:nitrite reductase/ring-hydroxylating ferredoxin subunit
VAKPAETSSLAELPEGKGRCVKLNGLELAVFRRAGRLLAIENACPHEGAALAEGELKGDFVVCPGHGYRFNLRTGNCSDAPDLSARVYPVALRGSALVLDEGPEGR